MAAEGDRNHYIFTGEEERNELEFYIVPQHVTHFSMHESVTVIPIRLFSCSFFLLSSRPAHPNIVELICHDGVKSIERWAFNGCPRLRRLIIPGVEVVEEHAFYGCETVTYIECDNLERIGEGAFCQCRSLPIINLPSAKVVERSAFGYCIAMKDAIFGKNLETIGVKAFIGCTSLEEITIPLKNGLIDCDDAFTGCDNLRRVDLVEGLVLQETVDALQLEEWRNDMNEEIESINIILPNASSGFYTGIWSPFEAGEKTVAIREWISRVLRKIIDYKALHRRLLNEAATALQLVLPNNNVTDSVLSFLELPLHSFDGEGCSSCRILENDEIKLKVCDKCDLARYCSDECQENHREIHEGTCFKRAAEIREEILFRQPESSHLGDCPICFLPMLLTKNDHMGVVFPCCCQVICKGCDRASMIREIEQGLKGRCPFCRKPVPNSKSNTNEELKNIYAKRAEANDPVAIEMISKVYYDERDYDSAFKITTRAAALGDAVAHFSLSLLYQKGLGVEKDEKMMVHHLEEAAIAGHPYARHDLGCYEEQKERFARAAKHFIIAANLGCDESIKTLIWYYKNGHVSKDDYLAALHAYQDAVLEAKSPQREEAAKY